MKFELCLSIRPIDHIELQYPMAVDIKIYNFAIENRFMLDIHYIYRVLVNTKTARVDLAATQDIVKQDADEIINIFMIP